MASSRGDYKLTNLKTSPKKDKKYVAEFTDSETGKRKYIHFGASGYQDFTIHKDPVRASLYRKRHARDLLTEAAKTGMSPGALSYYILWSSPSMAQGIRNFKNEYKL